MEKGEKETSCHYLVIDFLQCRARCLADQYSSEYRTRKNMGCIGSKNWINLIQIRSVNLHFV